MRAFQEFIVASYSGEYTCLASRSDADVAQGAYEAVEVLFCSLGRIDALVFQIFKQMAYIGDICLACVAGHASFQRKVGFEVLKGSCHRGRFRRFRWFRGLHRNIAFACRCAEAGCEIPFRRSPRRRHCPGNLNIYRRPACHIPSGCPSFSTGRQCRCRRS